MRYFVTIRDRTFEVDLSGGTPAVDGEPVQAELAAVPGSAVRHLLVEGRSHALVARPGARHGEWELVIAGERYPVEVVDERTRAVREMTGAAALEAPRAVVAPMPGMIVRVEVEVGETVRAGQGVVIVEAMKMENELKAPADGVVSRIEVAAGQAVEKGATLLVLEQAEP